MGIKTAREVRVQSEDEWLTPDKIAAIRVERLGVSQVLFAGLLNVAPQTIHAWEQGLRRPSAMATRLLLLANDYPSAFTKRLQSLREGNRG
jgi:DNA-binding transcriptional regulator YiaG